MAKMLTRETKRRELCDCCRQYSGRKSARRAARRIEKQSWKQEVR